MSNTTENNNSNASIDVLFYRKLVKQHIEMRRYQTALFWAEKVCMLSLNDSKDVYTQASCMFSLKEYHRAAHLIRFHKLEKTHLPSYNLLLESLYCGEEYTEAVSVINSIDVEFLASSLINQPLDGMSMDCNSFLYNEECGKNELMASICFLKGKIYEALDNRAMAMDFYVQALHKSIYCSEALDALVQHEMLMAWEEKELMQHLPFVSQSSEADAKMIITLYETKLKKYYASLGPDANIEETPIGNLETLKTFKDLSEKMKKSQNSEINLHKSINMPKLMTPVSIMSPADKVLEDLKIPPFSLQVSLNRASSIINESQRSHLESPGRNRTKENIDNAHSLALSVCMERIQKSTDMMASEAEKCFYDSDYQEANQILNVLLDIDPFHDKALTLQIGCLVEFREYNKLFYVAHKLVDRYPDKAIAWYAVGCYYDLIHKSDPARRYLSKATTLDRLYGPAWLAYGHSFAKENEHDQAMAAYFKATQLMRGCHLPLLYIGVECGLTKNLELAEKFFYQAMSIAPWDVFVLHELGVIKYEYEYYESAEEVFRTTVEIITARAKQNNEEVSARWEPLFNNLGHCCRKNKKYEEALEYHQKALLLKPQSAATYTAIGFVHALMFNLDEAVTYFHKSLALHHDCIFTTTILKSCIEDLMESDNIIDKICGTTTKKTKERAAARLEKMNDASTVKYSGMKLKFEEDDAASNTENVSMDMSMEN